jgi:hypothetical protein
VGVSDDAAQGIGEGGGIAAGDVDVPPVGGGDEPAVGVGLSRIAGEGAAEVLHGLPPNRGVVSGGVVPERGETGVVGGRKDKGLLGEDREDGGVRRSDGVEQVDGGIANGIMAVDVEKLTGRAVKAVKWHVVGVDCATTRTEDGTRSADVRRRGRG